MTILFMLLVWHAIADYPLQGDFLAKAKNRFAPVPGIPWYQGLAAHALIHAGGVLVITGNVWFALFELVAHAYIDDQKCSGKITFNHDQVFHVACKVIYALVAAI